MLEIVIIYNNFSFISNIINNVLTNSSIKIIGIFNKIWYNQCINQRLYF